jgi:3D-(3,5/4)-trihydroxycyclohexane-1,2-dione acylhydrolase (decyclizing)
VKLDGIAVTADAKEAIAALHKALAEVDYASGYAAGELPSLKAEWDHEVDRLYALEHEAGLSQTLALGVINETLQPSDVIVAAAGSLPGDLHRLWRPVEPKTYHMEYGFSCMGYEVSGAFGAALAEPDRDVYAVVGDGSYLMLHSELVTSLQEGVKMTVLLFDNSGFQCIHNLQRGHGSDGFGNEFRFRNPVDGKLSGSYMPMDFAAHARSLGARAYTVHTAEQLREAILLAREETVSTLIEMKVVPGTNTAGYESWWRVDVPAVSVSPKVEAAHREMAEETGKARQL